MMYIWSDIRQSFAPPFGDEVPLRDRIKTVSGVTTKYQVIDYFSIIVIIANMRKLRRWYTHGGGRERIREHLGIEDHAMETTDELIISRVNAVLKPVGKGFTLFPVSHIKDFEWVFEDLCSWTITVGIPPYRAFFKSFPADERVEIFYNRNGMPDKLGRLSTLFGEEFAQAVSPSVIVDRQDALLPYLRLSGYGEGARGGKVE
ncbi:hypothetical protein CALVIDRAFT_595692 [Calocera viscosa TUFC12733]|uniref:Uncharacterized protein n=1 Tax=Calocera viscosa (strain TUFC12733) TaxID=1330018 RepID=A0A167Q9V0_CALVF|nr:hypothetical protein CALVIDRAFT_595692 [Calocera viscosa TUFC12733]